MTRALSAIVFIPMAVSIAAGGEPPTAPPPRLIPVTEWVKQLGSNDSRERDAAVERLSALTLDPPPELLLLTKVGNPDIQKRASKIAQSMRWNVAATRLSRGQQFAEKGQIDLFVAATEIWDLKPEDPRLWVPAVDYGRQLIGKAEMKDYRKPHNCPSSFRDYVQYLELRSPLFTRIDDKYIREGSRHCEAIQARGVEIAGGIFDNLIISRESVKTHSGIQQSVVFANGDVTAVTALTSVVIVCDGDVNLTTQYAEQALIIARGNITIGRAASASVLLAGGKVTGAKNSVNTSGLSFNVVKENTTEMLGIKFFELSTLGFEVKLVDKNLELSEITSERKFFRAGLLETGVKVGDVFVDVNGKKPDSPESLRRLFRDALAIGDATVKLKRGDKTMTVKVTLPE
jgi:hypothetical protein